jgi:hypothetical protein
LDQVSDRFFLFQLHGLQFVFKAMIE